jgi:DNA-binding NtrC family response regulator
MPITFVSPNDSTPVRRPQKGRSLLVVDCPPDRRAGIEQQCATAQLSVRWADTAAAAVVELRRCEMPVLIDFSRGVSALKIITELRAHMPAMPLWAVVEPDHPELVIEAVLAGVADVLPPDVSGTRLAAALMREAGEPVPATGPHDFYQYSPEMREACAAMARMPAARTGVLVRGEDGAGREMAARAIHAAAGPERAGRFVSVDCAAFDAQQLEMELFGVAGRADEERLPARGLERLSRGSRLHAALGGSLYLRNVPDASTRVQRRLLRVLRDREVVVDDGSVAAFDVRCMTGADDSLAAAVQDGRLDETLCRRLSAQRIDLPPLRRRREDIPALANTFLRDTCASLKTPVRMFSRSALALLAALPWSGNAGELRDLIRAIVCHSAQRGIGVEHVLAQIRLDTGSVTLSQTGTLRQARTRFEHEYIAAVLRQHRGRITQAAKTLGIQRTNLYRKMRTLKVPAARR